MESVLKEEKKQAGSVCIVKNQHRFLKISAVMEHKKVGMF